MGYLYSLSGFQPNVPAHEAAESSVDVLVDYAPRWFNLIGCQSPTVCAKCVPARQNAAKFGSAPQQQGSSQEADSEDT
jgi:hypothetical protein